MVRAREGCIIDLTFPVPDADYLDYVSDLSEGLEVGVTHEVHRVRDGVTSARKRLLADPMISSGPLRGEYTYPELFEALMEREEEQNVFMVPTTTKPQKGDILRYLHKKVLAYVEEEKAALTSADPTVAPMKDVHLLLMEATPVHPGTPDRWAAMAVLDQATIHRDSGTLVCSWGDCISRVLRSLSRFTYGISL